MTIKSDEWRTRRVALLNGSGDTRKGTLRAYNTISLGEIFDAADKPTATEKFSAKAIIPSSYASPDARVHAVQREKGSYPILAADIDKGDVSLEHLEAAVDAIFGLQAASLIYSTASAVHGNRKWRIVAPLIEPVPFEVWERGQLAFFELLRSHGIVPDETLSRAGQLIYLPNVPPDQRRGDGEPIYYETSIAEGLPVNLSRQPISTVIQSLAETQKAAEAKRAADLAAMALRKALRRAAGTSSQIERFNANNPLEDVLIKYGYEQKYAQSCDWRSPLQTSGSFATQAHREPDGGYWISLSGSDAEAGLGAPTVSGNRFGDAFDLFVHFEHNGDRASALAAISEKKELPTGAEEIVAQPYRLRDTAAMPARVWIVDHLLLRGTVTVLTAPGGSGKTTFTMGLAISIATGKPILDMTVRFPGKVWIWNLEDDNDELTRSVKAACQHHGINEKDLEPTLFLNSALDGSSLCTATEGRDGMTLLQPVFEEISCALKNNGIRVLIIDPFVSSHAVEENSNTKIDKIVKAWARVAREADCAVIIVHHTSKSGAGEVSSASARGASALTSAARGVLVINKMTAEQARTLGVPAGERWRYINVQDDKHSRAPAEEARWFEILSVDLENGDNVGVASPWAVPPDVPLYSAGDVRAVQKLAATQTFRRDFRAADWIGHAIGCEIGIDSSDPANRGRLDRIAREWVRQGYFEIEKRKDSGRKEREYLVPGAVPISVKDAIEGGASVEKS